MLEYIKNNLLTDEKFIYGIRPHWIIFSSSVWALIFSMICWIYLPDLTSLSEINIFADYSVRTLIALACFVTAIYWMLSALIYYYTSEYGVTSSRVLIKVGWIRRISLELMLDKVEGVLVNQSIPGRILNYGTITIIGTGGTRDQFPFIPDPMEFRKQVQTQVEIFEKR